VVATVCFDELVVGDRGNGRSRDGISFFGNLFAKVSTEESAGEK